MILTEVKKFIGWLYRTFKWVLCVFLGFRCIEVYCLNINKPSIMMTRAETFIENFVIILFVLSVFWAMGSDD